MLLNRKIYESERDGLVYDGSHDIDAANATVALDVKEDGTLKRGVLLDIESDAEKYAVHKEGGTAAAIVALDTSYSGEDTEIVAPVYISGAFRESAVRTDAGLTAADRETLREKGIILK